MASVADPIPHECVNCHRPLGISVKVIPHFIQDGGGELKVGEGKMEAWCPICFVKVRAHRETMDHGGPRYAPDWHPKRLVQGQMRAIKCKRCGNESLSMGHLGCMQCPPPPHPSMKPHQEFVVLNDEHYAAVRAGARSPMAAGAAPGGLPMTPGSPEAAAAAEAKS